MNGMIGGLITLLFTGMMHMGSVGIVADTPDEAAGEFLDALAAGDQIVMESYADNPYIDFSSELDYETRNKLFENFTYQVDEIATKNDVAVAKVTITTNDFSQVMNTYNKEAYDYIMSNLYSNDIADKAKLAKKCLEIYQQDIAKAAEGKTVTRTIYIPMVDDGSYGWKVLVRDDMMKGIYGNITLP